MGLGVTYSTQQYGVCAHVRFNGKETYRFYNVLKVFITQKGLRATGWIANDDESFLVAGKLAKCGQAGILRLTVSLAGQLLAP